MLLGSTGAFVGAASRFSARSYVQDGLISMWDGIENAGYGQHDAENTSWTELIGSIPLKASSLGNCTWTANGLQNATASEVIIASLAGTANNNALLTWWQMQGIFGERVGNDCALTSNYTLEMVYSGTPTSSWKAVGFHFYKVRNYWEYQQIYFNSKYRMSFIPAAGWNNGGYNDSMVYNMTGSIGRPVCYSGVANLSSGSKLYANGVIAVTGTALPGRAYDPRYATEIYVPANGTLHAIRLYSRALTADEIAANYAVDKARFNLNGGGGISV